MGGLSIILLLFLFGPFLFLALLLQLLGMALPWIAGVLLVCNAVFLAVLLLARKIWRSSGTMDRTYIDVQPTWKRIVLLVLRYGLMAFIMWELIVIIACAAYLIVRPDLVGILFGILD